jgi:hypothetical protein
MPLSEYQVGISERRAWNCVQAGLKRSTGAMGTGASFWVYVCMEGFVGFFT